MISGLSLEPTGLLGTADEQPRFLPRRNQLTSHFSPVTPVAPHTRIMAVLLPYGWTMRKLLYEIFIDASNRDV